MIHINGHWTLVLTLFMIIFKLLEDLTLSWWQVTSPLWAGIPLLILVKFIGVLLDKE
jgi:hypothetical protein